METTTPVAARAVVVVETTGVTSEVGSSSDSDVLQVWESDRVYPSSQEVQTWAELWELCKQYRTSQGEIWNLRDFDWNTVTESEK